MSTDALHIEHLRVERLYGISHDGVAAERLSREVNVIYGANGRGKTTFGRALQGLIWPEFVAPWRPTISGSFRFRGDEWSAAFEDGMRRIQRNGHDDQPSTLPSVDHRTRYWLSLHDLLQADGADFARQIRELAQGGQDVQAAARALDLKPVPGRAGNATRRFTETQNHRDEVERRHRELRNRERGLEDLRRRRAEAEAAARRAELVERALDLNAARRDAAAAREALAQLPDVLAHVRPEDADQVRARLDEQRQAENRREAASRDLEAARRRESEHPVVTAGRPPSPLADLRERQRELAAAENDLAKLKQDIAAADAAVAEAWSAIASRAGADPDAAPEPPDADTLAEIDDLVRQRAALHQRQEAHRALMQAMGTESTTELADEQERAQAASRALEAWLAETHRAASQPPFLFPLAAGSAALFVVVGAAATVAWHPAGALALLAGVALAAVAVALLRLRPAPPDDQRRAFEETGLEAPTAWDADAVRARQREVAASCARLAVALERTRLRDARTPDAAALELEAKRLDEAAAGIRERLGLQTPADGSELIVFARALVGWHEARRRHAALLAKREEAWQQSLAALKKFNAPLEALGFERATDASGAAATVDRVDEAYRELAAIDASIDAASRDRREAEEHAQRAGEAVQDICQRLSVDPADAVAGARRLCEQLPDFTERQRASTEATAILARQLERVQAALDFTPDLLEATDEQLGERLRLERETAATRDELSQEIGGIESAIAAASREHDLELAIADHEAAKEDLKREYEEACATSIGDLLAKHLDEATREAQLPPVFHRAKHLFASFTQSRYDLRLDTAHGQFSAVDTVRRRGCPLDDLSSGTRVQLLLAVRIAFVEVLESGCKLPILLDEALANSDDARAEAIIDAVLALCRDGRQVFYFTAQDDEVLKWKRVAERHHDVECAFIPLPADAGPIDLDASALPDTSFVRDLPSLGSDSRAEYGRRLGVPAWTGWDEVAALHVWYLEPSLTRLYQLLSRGYEQWGQLEALSRAGSLVASGYDAAGFAPLAARAAALEAWQKAWRVGRGRRVDREALAASGAVTSRFIDRATELCAGTNGDARALIDCLHNGDLAGFRSNKRDDLEEYLLAEGYLDESPPLAPADIWTEVIVAVHPLLKPAGLTEADIRDFLQVVQRGPAGAP